MKSYRNILSLLLLSAYALFLLHDFVPHSHHEHHDNSSLALHAEDESHQHGHDYHHHHDADEEDSTPESSENNGSGVHLISFHSHTGSEAHHHDLAYRAASKDELVVPVLESPLLLSYRSQLQVPSGIFLKDFEHFNSSFSNSLLFSSIGLRAPPALG